MQFEFLGDVKPHVLTRMKSIFGNVRRGTYRFLSINKEIFVTHSIILDDTVIKNFINVDDTLSNSESAFKILSMKNANSWEIDPYGGIVFQLRDKFIELGFCSILNSRNEPLFDVLDVSFYREDRISQICWSKAIVHTMDYINALIVPLHLHFAP